MKKLRSCLKAPGGKQPLANSFIQLFPPHLHYVEPYFCTGAVLFAKPAINSEVVNDLNGDIIFFWKVLQDKSLFKIFQEYIALVPFSEEEFEYSKSILRSGKIEQYSQIVRAASLFVVARMSLMGIGDDFATLSKNRVRRKMNEQVSSYLSAIELLPQIHERLQQVVILNRPALDVIHQQDSLNTLHFCDPPYLPETRVSKKLYEYEMTFEDHEQLLEELLKVRGKVMLCGYANQLYNSVLKGWTTKDFKIDSKMGHGKKKATKVERLWMNY